jgi:hypothetical protein
MSESDGNYDVFQDRVSSAILEKYSTTPHKKIAKRYRKSAPAAEPSILSGLENGEIDPAELADFIEVIPKLLPKCMSSLSPV